MYTSVYHYRYSVKQMEIQTAINHHTLSTLSFPDKLRLLARHADLRIMTESNNNFPRAGFFRRLAAMIYDILVAVAVGMCAAMVMLVVLLLLTENGLIDNLGFEHFSDVIQHSLVYQSILQGWVAIWVIGFFLWFWRNGGQTMGMRAWRLRLFSTNDKPLGYGRAFIRLISSLGGIGTLLVLFDIKYKQSLQDRIAGTEMLVLSKQANHHTAWKDI